MSTGVLLSVRDKSKRFPGKVRKKIGEHTVTDILISRLKLATGADTLILATSDDPRDRVFEEIAKNHEIEIFYGSQDDKLLRYRDIANHYGLDEVVIVDGDDMLVFPEFIDKTIDVLRLTDADAVFTRGLPLGAASSGLTREALNKVVELKAEDDTEVWGGYFIDSGHFDVNFIFAKDRLFNHPDIRLTLDYEEDFELLEEIISHFNFDITGFTSSDLMKLLLEDNPELVKLNKAAQLRYESHISSAAEVKFKE